MKSPDSSVGNSPDSLNGRPHAIERPQAGECEEYYSRYIDAVPADESVIETLREAPDALEGLLSGLSPDRERYAYEPGKWTLRDVVGHIVDTERALAFRALHIARADTADLPGMDQDEWAAASNAGGRRLADLLGEFRGLRSANAALFASLDEEALGKRGVASGCEFTVRALVYIIVGHELHHREVIRARYLEDR